MSILEIVLVIMVTVWTVIFIGLGVAFFILLKSIKSSLDRINHILESAEHFTEGVETVGDGVKAAASSLMGLLGRRSGPQKIVNAIRDISSVESSKSRRRK